jgi:hypothetical protein
MVTAVEVGEGEGESGGGPPLSVGGQCFLGYCTGRDVVSPPMIDRILLFTFACAERENGSFKLLVK